MSPTSAFPRYGCWVLQPSETGSPRRAWVAGRQVYLALGLASVAAVVLRLPTFRYALVSDDEAIYDAMAQVVSHGGTMYRDTVDHKPPGLVYTYSAVRGLTEHLGCPFSSALTGVHVLGIAVVVATCLALYGIAREVLATRLQLLPPLLYAVVSATNIPPDALAVNGELLMNLPTALGVLCVLMATRRSGATRLGLDVLAGLLCGIAALFKYQAIFVCLAFVFLLPDPRNGLGKTLAHLVARGLALGAGVLLPFALVAAYMQSRGALDDAIRWGLAFNLHYLAEGPDLRTAAARFGMQVVGTLLPNGLVYGAGLLSLGLLISRQTPEGEALHGVTRARLLLAAWALESLACVTLGRRFFGHYFLQPELALSVLAAGPVAHLWDRRPRIAALALALPALVFFTIKRAPRVLRTAHLLRRSRLPIHRARHSRAHFFQRHDLGVGERAAGLLHRGASAWRALYLLQLPDGALTRGPVRARPDRRFAPKRRPWRMGSCACGPRSEQARNRG